MENIDKIKLIITGKRDKSIKESQELFDMECSDDPCDLENFMDGEALHKAGYMSGYVDGLNFALLVIEKEFNIKED